jgi:hypothetical protein
MGTHSEGGCSREPAEEVLTRYVPSPPHGFGSSRRSCWRRPAEQREGFFSEAGEGAGISVTLSGSILCGSVAAPTTLAFTWRSPTEPPDVAAFAGSCLACSAAGGDVPVGVAPFGRFLNCLGASALRSESTLAPSPATLECWRVQRHSTVTHSPWRRRPPTPWLEDLSHHHGHAEQQQQRCDDDQGALPETPTAAPAEHLTRT